MPFITKPGKSKLVQYRLAASTATRNRRVRSAGDPPQLDQDNLVAELVTGQVLSPCIARARKPLSW